TLFRRNIKPDNFLEIVLSAFFPLSSLSRFDKRHFCREAPTVKTILLTLISISLTLPLLAQNNVPTQFNEATIAELQAQMRAGKLTSVQLTKFYLERIAALDQNPCGSSSGSGAAVSANFVTVSLGSETDGSIVCPGNANGVVALKPTVGLVSRAGVVPISHTQDTVGPHTRTVRDAAATLSVIQSRTFDGRDPATGGVPLGWQGTGKTRPIDIPTDYTQFVDPNGLNGARLGLTTAGIEGFDSMNPTRQEIIDAFDKAADKLRQAGATVIDLDKQGFTFPLNGNAEFLVLTFEFRQDVKKYFATRVGVPVAGGTLSTAIQFNRAHAAVEMPFFNQDIFTFCAALAQGPNTP